MVRGSKVLNFFKMKLSKVKIEKSRLPKMQQEDIIMRKKISGRALKGTP